jgi:ubiquinone/menaquinone biosynthesis C-methylase UbiE
MAHSSWERDVIKHFDRSAHGYGESYRGNSPTSYFFKTRLSIVACRLKAIPHGKLLDVACGPGVMVETCVGEGFEYFGLDISKEMIAECRKRFADLDDAHFYIGKMQNLPFPDDCFDVLLCMGGLEYVPAAEEVAARLEMIRVVRPGGLLMVSHLNGMSPYWLWHRFVYQNSRSIARFALHYLRMVRSGRRSAYRDDRVPLRQFTVRSSRRIIEAGCQVVGEPVYYCINLFFPPFDEKYPRLSVRICEWLEKLGESPLRWLAMAFILVVRKQAERPRQHIPDTHASRPPAPRKARSVHL